MYYALWIPCLTPIQPAVIVTELKRTLKDVQAFEACNFHSTADMSSCDVTLGYSLSPDQPFKHIDFKCLHRTHTGIIVYSLVLPSQTDKVTDTLAVGMHPSIYHIIKSHFHRHSFHAEECDTLLKPYCSNQAIDIANQAVMKTIYTFYLEQYRKKLQGAVIDLSAQYNHLRSLEKNNNFWSYLKEAKRIKESCDETLGEAAYAKSLLAMSRASVRTRIYETLTALTSDLDRISVKCTDTYTITNNRFNNRLGIYGLVAGLLSIFLTITLELIKCSGPDGEDAYRDEYVRLKQRADSLNMENERILRQFEKINP